VNLRIFGRDGSGQKGLATEAMISRRQVPKGLVSRKRVRKGLFFKE